MRIRVVAVGKLKEIAMREAARVYLKRLAPYAPVTVEEVEDEPEPKSPTEADVARVQEVESARVAARVRLGGGAGGTRVVAALDRTGQELSSVEFAAWIERLIASAGCHELCFAIGGACGLSQDFLAQADRVVSLSRMTFPHQLARVMLLEQLYRAFKIMRGEPYHK